MKKSIVLTGMMGSGKSSLGKKLAARLQVPFIDADAELEKAEGMTIPEMFAKHGEPWFRAKEKITIAMLLNGPNAVIATGGGAVMDPLTRKLIREKAVGVWLQADVPTLFARVAKDKNRPLLQKPDPQQELATILAAREAFYAEAPVHHRTDDAAMNEVLEALVKKLAAHG
jgi:shikimate kinase